MEYSSKVASTILNKTPALLRVLLTDLDFECIHAREGKGSWSPIEIVAHLILGEKTDWIPRAQIILESSFPSNLEPFDMESHLEYASAHTLEELLSEFELLRKENIETLESLRLDEQSLNKRAIHPELGEITLKQHLSTWIVHDLGHIAQISRVLAKQYRSEVGPWSEYLTILNDREPKSEHA
ncbi:MAG: DinB family protein [Flavobacteriales bacterium]|nr:DinB family protein [Flavobacteriales bacterium]